MAFEYNGKRLPDIGEPIFLIAREVKINVAGRKYQLRDPHRVELVKARVFNITLSMDDEPETGICMVRYSGEALSVDRGYAELLPFTEGSFAYSEEEGKKLLEKFLEKGFEIDINNKICFADHSICQTEPLAVLED